VKVEEIPVRVPGTVPGTGKGRKSSAKRPNAARIVPDVTCLSACLRLGSYRAIVKLWSK
jgi:hypothetical protein